MTTTKVQMPVWEQAAIRAEELSAKKQVWTYGRPSDTQAMWASGPGMGSYQQHAEPDAIAVLFVEWFRNESHSDDDSSRGGLMLDPRSGYARCQSYASVFRAEDGTLTLGRWRDDSDNPTTLPKIMLDFIDRVREW